ncbi:hypothetical protein BOX15_Mlig028870g3 [Macrostomum lignano]|uniref:Calmodulin n=3 Tax=Macrostomum lignano TaxID=282301 RepID=A0A1I8GUY9_9PLAT|nr:hypothetical protein BOX15_Mlig028870g2 [Macrostomum lignano]PAA89091.1 hypothetical protein BOX15_Mlig028870g1 [Macrostomum lignano]PAA91822.1 hypothetical protein BOX15_Mlig028870g4 [Macrostomum lignano]PAA94528.1 hypothetical protein BOX15_Mlig028870g3 [Macrostomum lignano]
MQSLTPAQVSEYQEAFKLFDKNNDGKITPAELGVAMRNLGQNPTEADIQKMISDVDHKKKGYVEFEEFVEMMEKKKRETDTEQELRKVFKIFDKNNDGKISSEELRYVMNSLGENLTESDVNEMIRQADKNQDGFVDFQEFKLLMDTLGGI